MTRTRATASVVAVALLVGVAVLIAAVVASTTLAAAPDGSASPGTSVAVTVRADAATDRVELTHRGGDALAVTDTRVVVSVDGRRLAHQPPVPFFAARGFEAGPTGPFNVAADDRWTAGETAGFEVASTNRPPVEPGSEVRVVLYRRNYRVAVAETRAE